MQKVDGKEFNKKITKDFSYSFKVINPGLYLIEITASAKSWWQNYIKLHSFFKDDDLAIKIDGRAFPKLDGRRGLFDGEVAWNGNNLKGLSKTNVFFARLEAGEHTLLFLPDQKPILEKLAVFKIEKDQEISYIPSSSNPLQDGNRRQWITLATVDLSVKSLNITAKAQEGRTLSLFKRDDSDIKLVIDGEIQKNDEPKSHKYWFWCGRTLKGNSKTFSKELNFTGNRLHYIELWADRTPKVEKITLSYGQVKGGKQKNLGKVALYKDITNFTYVYLRSDPHIKDNNIIEKLTNGAEIEILENEVIGDWVEGKSYIWHKVRHKGKGGYILSSFVEMNGQERGFIVQKIKQRAQELGLEEGIIIALAGCESRFKPYATSKKYDPEDTKIGKGIFQITDQLKLDLNNPSKPFFSEVSELFDVNQNISAGTKYFQWLYQERYGSDSEKFKKAVAAYNAGPYSVPAEERLQLNLYDDQTQQFVACVEENFENTNWKKIFWPTIKKLFIFALIFTGAYFINQNDFFEPINRNASVVSIKNEEKLPKLIFYNSEEEKLVFYDMQSSVIGEIPYWRLRLETIFKVPDELQDMKSMRFREGTRISPHVFYFFASTFYACGAQNCTWALYRYNVKEDALDFITNDIFGADVEIFPSPDFSKFLIRRDVHGSACDTGTYVSIMYPDDGSPKEALEFSDEFYPTVFITSLAWQDKERIKFTAYYHDCSNASRSPAQKDFVYLIREKESRRLPAPTGTFEEVRAIRDEIKEKVKEVVKSLNTI